jgi:hypothetical protein
MVVQLQEASADETDAAQLFKDAQPMAQLDVPLSAQ